MLGERIGDGKGQVTSQRVLPSDGGPKMETSFRSQGTLLGVATSENGTYWARVRPDGTLYGEGQGIVMSAAGDAATWVGQGVGTLGKDGSISYRGAIYVQTAAPNWVRLNRMACVYEYEIDAQGATRSQLFEWQ